MIFEISATESQLVSSNRSLLIDVVCELLRAHRMGHHFLILTTDVANWLLAEIQLSAREHATLVRVRNLFAQSSSLRNKALMRVVIDLAHKSGPVIDGNRLAVNLQDFSTLSHFEKTRLLVENSESDGKFYVKLLDGLKSKIEAPNVVYELHNGGGQGLFKVWEQQIEEGRIVCMLADSDRKHFSDPEKPEVKGARDFANNLSYKFAWATTLPCREIENLVPPAVLEKLPLAFNKLPQIKALMKISAIEDIGSTPVNERFSMYYDFKKGVESALKEQKYEQFVCSWVEQKIAHGGSVSVFSGLGENIISQLLAHAEAWRSFLTHAMSDAWWLIYEDVFSIVLWLGFAPRKQAT
jgi:hypothetical protein